MMLKVFALVLLCAVVVTGRRAMSLNLEWVTSNTVSYSFKRYKKVNDYYVKVAPTDSPDEIVYDREFRKSSRRPDGRYYVEVFDLTPNTEYTLEVFNGKKMSKLVSVKFTTSCSKYKFQCQGLDIDGQTIQKCLNRDELCDDVAACIDETDEKTNPDGTCLNTLPLGPERSFWSGLVGRLGDWAGIY